MRTRVRRLLFSALSLCIALFGTSASAAKNSDYRYFPETGHWVTGDFLFAYESISDPVRIYGYPITDAFENPTSNRSVQYFQKAYFELLPENPPELRVLLAPLGEYLYQPEQEIVTPVDINGCKSFVETGHQVCYAFLDFFEDHGGIAQFGYPKSDIEIHDGWIAQYFQRAAFEWHPELPPGNRVVLKDLGWQYFNAQNEDPARLSPNRESRIPQSIISLRVRAFVAKSVMAPTGKQTLYVIVQDQNLFPIQNSQVICIVRNAEGLEWRYVMPLTNNRGVTTLDFWLEQQASGRVEVLVTAVYDKFEEHTRTSFSIWY